MQKRDLIDDFTPLRSLPAFMKLEAEIEQVINDSLGHLIGDKLLLSIARVLESCVRQEDTIARLGGDEFIILLENIQTVRDASCIAERIQQELTRPFNIDRKEVFINSFGMLI